MGRKASRRPAELIADLVSLGTATLVQTLGISEPQAREAMREVAHNLARNHGGTIMYIPKDMEFRLTRRDMRIYERMGRENVHDLAKEYQLTAQQLYAINRCVRDQMLRNRQDPLPGFEPAEE